MSCSCPYHQVSPCKHLWALLLAADAKGWGAELCREDEGADDADQDEADPDSTREVWATRSRGQLPQRAPPPDWQSLMAQLDLTSAAELERRSARGVDEDRECWLVLNTGETLARQHVHLDCMERRRKPNGDWGMWKPAACSTDDFVSRLPSQHSSFIRTLLTAKPATAAHARSYARDDFRPQRQFEAVALEASMEPSCWKSLASEAKLAVASQTVTGRQIRPATIDETWLWTDEIGVDRAANGRDWVISLRLRREDGLAVRLDEPLVVFPSGLVIFKDALAWMRPRSTDEFQWLALLQKRPRLTVPDDKLDALIGKLLQLSVSPQIQWSAEAVREGRSWTEEAEMPKPVLRLARSALSIGKGGALRLDVAFAYGERRVDASDPRDLIPLGRERHLLRRDARAERRFMGELLEHAGALVIAADALIELVERLETSGWIVEIERHRVRTPTVTGVTVKSGIDWFDLDADLRFGDQALQLPALLEAIAAKSPFVELADGSIGMLPSAWLQRFSALSQFGRVKDDHLRFDKAQLSFLNMLLCEMDSVTTDAVYAGLAAKLERFAGITAAEPPPYFQGELRPYQREGLGWLLFLREFDFGGCLADDMGLGKTIQVLAALPPAGGLPSLVVVPKSLVHNWIAEAAKFRPDLKVGTTVGGHDLVVATYGNVRRDVTRLRKVDFAYVILDEAQNIKNRESQTAKAVRVLKAKHRLALSGTPVENRVEDLVSIFEFLNPGMLTPSMFRKSQLRSTQDHSRHKLIAKALRPFILRRTKEEVLTDLPERTEQTIFCDLEGEQRTKYDELRLHYQANLMLEVEAEGLEKSKFHVLEALLRLRQAACHTGLLDDGKIADPSAKLEALIEHLLDVTESGHRALVFSQFTSLLAIVKSRLEREGIRYEYLDGQTRDRERRVRRFQDDDSIPVFLISLKAGGVGLNLTAADYCFILDPWWNPAVEAQAIARAHRIGQTRPVFAYRLIARGTVEEKILQLQASKRGLADAIVNADNASLSKMSLDDLRFLLQ